MSDNGPTDRNLSVDSLEAKAIYLVDESGATRATLNCSAGDSEDRGYVVFHFYDGDGRPRLTLQMADEEGVSITLFNKGNSPCVSLGVFNTRGNGITICSSEGKPRITVAASGSQESGPDDSEAEISIRDSHGEEVWCVP